MSDEIELGPWIEHDGKYPQPLEDAMPCRIRVKFSGGGRTKSPFEQAHDGRDIHSPCFIWKMRRRPWPWSEPRPICDDPAYAPIIRYRIGKPKPRAAKTSAQVEMLKAIARQEAEPAPEPVGEPQDG